MGLGTFTSGLLSTFFSPRRVAQCFAKLSAIAGILASHLYGDKFFPLVFWGCLGFLCIGTFTSAYIFTVETLQGIQRPLVALIGFGLQWTMARVVAYMVTDYAHGNVIKRREYSKT